MSSFSRDALSIVEDILPDEFGGGDHSTLVADRPEGIITAANGQTKLYAVSQSGSQKKVNMMSPALRRELKRLAQSGEGSTIVVDGVKYRFISHSGDSGTTTPVSNLS